MDRGFGVEQKATNYYCAQTWDDHHKFSQLRALGRERKVLMQTCRHCSFSRAFRFEEINGKIVCNSVEIVYSPAIISNLNDLLKPAL